MECTTVRAGNECAFMAKAGCSYIDGSCIKVAMECEGCNRIIEFSGQQYCSACPDPESKWKNGNCNLGTHIKIEVEEKIKINPIKASKRGG